MRTQFDRIALLCIILTFASANLSYLGAWSSLNVAGVEHTGDGLLPLLSAVLTDGETRSPLNTGGLEPTHNQIVSWAYDQLREDSNFDMDDFLTEANVLVNDYVVKKDGKIVGTGPDADGNSKYSQHYFNPVTNKGEGPEAVSEFYSQMWKSVFTKNLKSKTYKDAAWAAHFMADMNVPYHMVGTSRKDAFGRSKNPIFDEDVTGPHELYFYSSSWNLGEKIPNGWGNENNFGKALSNFRKQATVDTDWFDPWYLNGAIVTKHNLQIPQDLLILGTGSHAFWEAMVVAFYGRAEMKAELSKLSEDGFHGYDPLWLNVKADWGGPDVISIERHSKVFAESVARRTRNNILDFWKNPGLALAHAVRSVSTLFRATQTAIIANQQLLITEDGKQKVIVRVRNPAQEPLRNVEAKLIVGGHNYGVKRVSSSIPENMIAELEWEFATGNDEPLDAEIEILGEYQKTPDLGYKKLSFILQPSSENEEDQDADASNDSSNTDLPNFFERTGDNAHPPEWRDEGDGDEPDLLSLDDFQPMKFSLFSPHGEAIHDIAIDEVFCAKVSKHLATTGFLDKVQRMWIITAPNGTVILRNPGQISINAENNSALFYIQSHFLKNTPLGEYQFELQFIKDAQVIHSKTGALKLNPVFEEAQLFIVDNRENFNQYEVFRPGDEIAFIERFQYNSRDPEKTVAMDVVLYGPDQAIKAMESQGEYNLAKQSQQLTATAWIPNIIQEGLYTVDVTIKSGNSSVNIRKDFWVKHPVEFIGARTTPGDDFSLFKSKFGVGENMGYYMNFKFPYIRAGDQYSSEFSCTMDNYDVGPLSSPTFGPDPVQDTYDFYSSKFVLSIPRTAPFGLYQLNGVVWYNGVGYRSGNAYFKVGKEPKITITSPSPGFNVDEKVMIVTGTCDDLELTEGKMNVNGDVYPIKLKNGNFSAKTVLRPGNNNIRVSVENDGGESSDSVYGNANINAAALKVVLIWQAPNTDIDLWVKDPEGVETYYSNKSPGGGRKLDIDDKSGPGVETYTIESNLPGHYDINILYFSAHGYTGSVPFQLEVTEWETTPFERKSRASGTLYNAKGNKRENGSYQSFEVNLNSGSQSFF